MPVPHKANLQAGEVDLLEESLVKLCLEYSESLEDEAALSENLEESQLLFCSSFRGILAKCTNLEMGLGHNLNLLFSFQ